MRSLLHGSSSFRIALIGLIVLPTLALGIVACGGGEPDEPRGKPVDAPDFVQRWNTGLAAFDHFDFDEAGGHFESLAADHPDITQIWTNAGIARMNQATPESMKSARAHYERALEIDPNNLHARHCSGVLARYEGRIDDAYDAFREVVAADPDEPTASYYLATTLIALGRAEEAEPHLRRALENEPHQASALKNLSSLLRRDGRVEEGTELLEVFQKFREAETGNFAGIVYSEMGKYGDAIRRSPIAFEGGPAPELAVSWRLAAALAEVSPSAGQREMAWTRVADAGTEAAVPASDAIRTEMARSFGPGLAMADVDRDGDLDAWVATGTSSGALWLNDGGTFTAAPNETFAPDLAARSISAVFGDLDNDGWIDLFVACAGPNRLYMNREGRFEDVTASSDLLGEDAFTAQAVLADLDADSDLDIWCANLRRLDDMRTVVPAEDRLWLNDRDGTFSELAPEERPWSTPTISLGAIATDLDDDRDADLLVFHQSGIQAWRNDRIHRYRDATESFGLSSRPGASGGFALDLDGDGQEELVLLDPGGGSLAAMTREGTGRFVALQGWPSIAAHTATAGDHDNDGQIDLLTVGGDAAQRIDPRALAASTPALLPDVLRNAATRSVISADVNGDGLLDLVASRSGVSAPIVALAAIAPSRERTAEAGWLAIDLVGVREEGKMRANTGGVGARLTAMTGSRAQVQDLVSSGGLLGGLPPRVHFGLGSWQEADYVSVQWPDDLLQGESKLSSGQVRRITQTYRKSSSCPLLFVEVDGKMEFVTDFLGTGGLGFFLQPGVYAKPDATERVAIPRFTARDGQVHLSIHEPMEEVCYLDRATLLVIDHPIGTEVHPDERLATGAPAVTERLFHARRADRITPTTVRTLGGEVDRELLLSSDRRYLPGVHPDPRFLGYADPQEITLSFPLTATQRAAELVLHLDGWVEYPYSHVNFAAFQAGMREQTLSIDVRMEDGTWRELLHEFGYPAGMPRVMTVPLPRLPEGATNTLRLRTNLELYVDALWLAIDAGQDRLRVTEVQASKAILRETGYPREYSPDGAEPLLYDYALMDADIDFKTMAGNYTRFGDVRALLTEAEDHYVIFGRAEEILLSYDLPPGPPAGMTRTLILDTVGWCKDMDLYTAHPDRLDPMPFLDMPGYPYNPSLSPRFRKDWITYDRTWNTRQRSNARR